MLNICGYSSSINGPSWYLSFYLMALLMMCALDKIKISIRFIIGACAICWIFNFIFKTTDISVWDRFSDFCIYFPVVCIGKFSAMNINLQKLLHKMVQNYKGLILSILVLIFTLGMRMLTGAEMYGFRFIWIYSPFIYLSFAVILTYLKNDRTVNRLLDFLGGYSTEFWLFHAVFISKVFWIQWLLFLPKISLFIVVWEFVLVFLVTVLYRKFCMYKGEKTK